MTSSKKKNEVRVINSIEKSSSNCNSVKFDQLFSPKIDKTNNTPKEKEATLESEKKVFEPTKNSNSGQKQGLFTIDKPFKRDFAVENDNNSFLSLKRLISINSATNVDTNESEKNTVANQISDLTKNTSVINNATSISIVKNEKSESHQVSYNSKNTSKSIRPISMDQITNFNGIFSDTNSNNYKDINSVRQSKLSSEKNIKCINEILQQSNCQKLNHEKQEILSQIPDSDFNIDKYYETNIEETYINKENCSRSEKNFEGVGIHSKKISKHSVHDTHQTKLQSYKNLGDRHGMVHYNPHGMKPEPKCKQKSIDTEHALKYPTKIQDENQNCINTQHNIQNNLIKKTELKGNILEERSESTRKQATDHNINGKNYNNTNDIQARVFTTPANIDKSSNNKQCIISYTNSENNTYQTKMLTLMGFDEKIKKKIQTMKERKDKFYKRFFPEGSRASSNLQKKVEQPKPESKPEQRSQSTMDFLNEFTILKKIGSGQTSLVRLIQRKSDNKLLA